jgi:hypothetical protein
MSTQTKTVDEIAYDHVVYKLGEQASAQSVLAGIVERKAAEADRLIAIHERTARLFDLLLRDVRSGRLEQLEKEAADDAR